MGRRWLVILLPLVMCGGCASAAPPGTSQATATGSPTGAPSVAPQQTAPAILPSGTGDAARFAAFQAHVAASTTAIAPLLSALTFDADAAALNRDATAVQAWAKAESEWMTANPYAGCYGGDFTNWDSVRVHADKAAATALAGNFDIMEATFAISQYKKVAQLMALGGC